MPQGFPQKPQIASKFPRRPLNDPQEPFRQVVWNTLGNSVVTRDPKEAPADENMKALTPIRLRWRSPNKL